LWPVLAPNGQTSFLPRIEWIMGLGPLLGQEYPFLGFLVVLKQVLGHLEWNYSF